MPELLRPRVVGVAQVGGTVPDRPAWTSWVALAMPRYEAFDLGAVARCTTAWASTIRASGMPISCTAWAAATAVCSAVGSAMPTSSDAAMTIRRATNRASSPASSIRAR